jgi:SpoVK/Ycf46/Vps4 family AAA+-type ATPase
MTRRTIVEAMSYAASNQPFAPVVSGGPNSPALNKFCQTIEDEKRNQIQSVNGVQYISRAKIGQIEVGGFTGFKTWLDSRKICFTPKAKEFGLDNPKGCVLLGPPGTGKSRAAKFCAQQLGIPLVILKISELLNSLVGETEQNLKRVLDAVDAIDGCVLLIDEADKMLAGGASGAHVGDSGVFKRIYGTFLSWSQDSASKTFKMLTANRVSGFDPEALRKGRFDEVFFVDFPNDKERREIMEIHMKNRKIDLKGYNDTFWGKATTMSRQFNGAELEVAVSEAKLKAANAGRHSPTVEELLGEIKAISPMSDQLSKPEKESQEQLKKLYRYAGQMEDLTTENNVKSGRRVKIEG